MSTSVLVSVAQVTDFIKRCMISIGTPEEHASSLADVLVTADYRGHYSHGLNRLGKSVHVNLTRYTVGANVLVLFVFCTDRYRALWY